MLGANAMPTTAWNTGEEVGDEIEPCAQAGAPRATPSEV